MRRLVSATCLTLLLVAVSLARTWNVDPYGTGDAPTIQAAMDSSEVGDEILLDCGTYLERPIVVANGVTLRSATGGPDCATLQPENSGVLLSIGSVTDLVVIEGLTFTQGSGINGGGVHVSSSDPVEFRNCRFVDNRAVIGGAMWSFLSNVTLANTDIQGNRARSGAGIAANNSTLEIADCRIEFNVTVAAYGWDNYGGGLHLKNSQVTISDTEIRANQAGTGGSPAYLSGTDATLLDCAVMENYGSLWVEDASVLAVSGAVFHANGRGIRCWDSQLDVDRCTFHDTGPYAIEMFRCTASVARTIVSYGDRRAFSCGETPWTLTCSDLFGTPENRYTGCEPTATDVIYDDPLFCDAQGDDFTLSEGSPCLLSNSPCEEVIGAFGIGCIVTSSRWNLEATTWARIKTLYR